MERGGHREYRLDIGTGIEHGMEEHGNGTQTRAHAYTETDTNTICTTCGISCSGILSNEVQYSLLLKVSENQ